jgi:hypothetical protein
MEGVGTPQGPLGDESLECWPQTTEIGSALGALPTGLAGSVQGAAPMEGQALPMRLPGPAGEPTTDRFIATTGEPPADGFAASIEGER